METHPAAKIIVAAISARTAVVNMTFFMVLPCVKIVERLKVGGTAPVHKHKTLRFPACSINILLF